MEKLFKLQNEIGALVKNQENPFFKSRYFDVNQIIEHLKPLLEKHELIVLQPLSSIDGKMALMTKVCNKDGTVIIESSVPLPDAPDAQKYGSAITYFRRYALQSLFLLQAEDDDGNNAVKSAKKEVVKTEIKMTPEEAFSKANQALKDADNLDDLTLVRKQIKQSKILTAPQKQELEFAYQEKSETFDPTK